ncbi:hypothetical protein P8625_15705 [Tenacibaculum tangerinum]|uniref:Uncharacterized protein n=1 Tax=Tenacibaculum tangerinum TaxID=3038772 RepID=A0ABY8L298_9FLAO|nr:hypothetical protein [Tenacibaculum tangerinum]WGH75490.1 hypothetical protein P8625_15705 [Tenacibaculum tangerinum]
MKTIYAILALLLTSHAVTAQELNPNWKSDLTNMLHEFLQCNEPIDDISPCNKFVSEALQSAYGVNDFYSTEKNRHLIANEIYSYLKTSSKWTLLGKASDQNTLNNAQGYANLKKAVVAVYKGDVHGHIALILPGTLSQSSTWNLKVPNSASFFIYKPNKSYIGKKMSFAFSSTDKDKVLLYGRNY